MAGGLAKKHGKKPACAATHFSQETIQQLRMFHVLNGQQWPQLREHFIRKGATGVLTIIFHPGPGAPWWARGNALACRRPLVEEMSEGEVSEAADTVPNALTNSADCMRAALSRERWYHKGDASLLTRFLFEEEFGDKGARPSTSAGAALSA